MRGVARVHAALCALGCDRVGEELDVTKVVRGGQHGAVVAEIDGIDVGLVAAARPDAGHIGAENTGPAGPLFALHSLGARVLLARGVIVEQLVGTRVGLQIRAGFVPVDVGDEGRVALADAHTLELLARGAVEIDKVVVVGNRKQILVLGVELDVRDFLLAVLPVVQIAQGVRIEHVDGAVLGADNERVAARGIGARAQVDAEIARAQHAAVLRIPDADRVVVRAGGKHLAPRMGRQPPELALGVGIADDADLAVWRGVWGHHGDVAVCETGGDALAVRGHEDGAHRNGFLAFGLLAAHDGCVGDAEGVDGLEVIGPGLDGAVLASRDHDVAKDVERIARARMDVGECVDASAVGKHVDGAAGAAGDECAVARECAAEHRVDIAALAKGGLLALEGVSKHGPELDVLDAKGADLHGVVGVELDTKDLVAVAGLHGVELLSALPLADDHGVPVVEPDTGKMAALVVEREGQCRNAALVEALEDGLGRAVSAVPDVDHGLLADLSRGNERAVGMVGCRNDVVRVLHKEPLSVLGGIGDHTDTGRRVHDAALIVEDQIVARIVAAVAVHMDQLELLLGLGRELLGRRDTHRADLGCTSLGRGLRDRIRRCAAHVAAADCAGAGHAGAAGIGPADGDSAACGLLGLALRRTRDLLDDVCVRVAV
eukprot:comp22453_c0_seq1/m.55235 comp22453_c0_seq1/g.55235  ORF comp22453_c0_seq1/g.55235 comp22453_c0_seq1/m.55235 type:complete len:660 (+) comp22453_c0_seq1:308-2287(+)